MESRSKLQLKPFTGAELKAMRDHVDGDELLFPLLRWTGLRSNDAINLTWREVDLDREQIECGVKKSNRTAILPIQAELLSALRREHQRRNPQQNETVLQHANGKPFMTHHVHRLIVALGKRSAVQHAHPCRFRVAFAVDG